MTEEEKAAADKVIKVQKRRNYSMVILFAVMVAFTGMNLWFTHIQSQEAKHAACPAWLLIDSVYATQHPTTTTGVAFAAVVHRLASDCPKGS